MHLPPHIVYAVLAFVAGILTGKWLERQKCCKHDSTRAPAAGGTGVCPHCGVKIEQAELT